MARRKAARADGIDVLAPLAKVGRTFGGEEVEDAIKLVKDKIIDNPVNAVATQAGSGIMENALMLLS